jgi:hypothetical protein
VGSNLATPMQRTPAAVENLFKQETVHPQESHVAKSH